MKLKVEHLDDKGQFQNLEFNLSYLQFIKHLAFAGMGVDKFRYRLLRFSGFMLEFVEYFGSQPDKFTIPEVIFHDPTELGQISNRIGKALADFLAKKIYKAKYTHNYEDAMVQHGHPIMGKRPDLYCDTLSRQFAVEAKGFKVSTVSANKMNDYKSQSKEGPVPVHFSVASVAYNLYKAPTVKFHDPVGGDVTYAEDINKKLIAIYYRSILDTIEEFNLVPSIGVEDLQDSFISYQLPFSHPRNSLYLMLHKSIVDGVWDQVKEFDSGYIEDDINSYIDVDGVGLCIR
jgi:hypothetical protein